jgi:pyrroloquinoline quinone biosynthesis protein D
LSGPRLSPKARLRWDGREKRYLLLYPERGLALSDTASAILLLCDGSRSVDAIVEELARQRPSSPTETIRADVVAFLEQMRKRGIVRWDD